jgi:hypothetical protein
MLPSRGLDAGKSAAALAARAPLADHMKQAPLFVRDNLEFSFPNGQWYHGSPARRRSRWNHPDSPRRSAVLDEYAVHFRRPHGYTRGHKSTRCEVSCRYNIGPQPGSRRGQGSSRRTSQREGLAAAPAGGLADAPESVCLEELHGTHITAGLVGLLTARVDRPILDEAGFGRPGGSRNTR